jgi:hypothetical protein
LRVESSDRTARFFALLAALCVAAVAALVACSSAAEPSTTADPTDSTCFLALPSDFAPFKTWPSNHFESSSDVGGGVHVSGPRTEYYNHAATKGATSFPVGTLIVKVLESADPTQHHVFAMAKRGCGFNSEGAKDWEWFELEEETTGAPKILWRGVAPPSGDKYNGDPTGGCNSCHGGTCASNDSVCSPSEALHL